MKIVHKDESRIFQNSASCQVSEYGNIAGEMSVAVARISGRYPDQGFALNEECSEAVYILDGAGLLGSDDGAEKLAAGDCIYIGKGERYYWEGSFSALISSAPAWDAGQYKNII